MSLGVLALTVALGALGAVLRWLIGLFLNPLGRSRLAIALVNIAGSALGGGLLAFPHQELTLALTAGLCAGLTTFSTLALQLISVEGAPPARARVMLAFVHVAAGIGSCFIAYSLVSLAL
ncbi:MAG: CrcB family protein [Microbacteriaceae bacterium]|jgi:fluoride exporter|nr:hypothetical protein [Microbacteriaceae bacterium]|tara:strand:- start:1769 stop:2128 length:360 start_codon:yes stop_codon:yes gene_type:complete